jgi:hypothetical protein
MLFNTYSNGDSNGLNGDIGLFNFSFFFQNFSCSAIADDLVVKRHS